MNLHEKLVEIRKEIDVFTRDTQGYGYQYVSGSQVLSKIQDKMNELGVLLFPSMSDIEDTTYDYVNHKGEERTDFVIKGNMLYVWQNADDPEDAIKIPWKLYGQQDDISKA